MFRNLKSTHPQKQLDLLHLLFPCAHGSIPSVACSPAPAFLKTRSAATARPFRSQVTEDYERPQLPLYIRRETHYPPSTSAPPQEPAPSRTQTKQGSSPRNSSRESVHRSRHFNPSHAEKLRHEIHLLEPHVLSTRLKKLCDAGQIDSAVSMLKNAPLDAQNTPVWNTLIWECMKAKRFKLGYQLFTDMKRRGFSPTTRTFQTMFMGLSRIENWSGHTKQLANAHSLYDSFQRHVNSIKKHDKDNLELSVNPLAAYIKILGATGLHQEVFDVYYAMDSDGSLAPNQFVYTAMFQALSAFSNQDRLKNAADARLLWTQMQKASQKSPGFQVDAFIVTSAVSALSRGRLADQIFAFQIVRDYFGLTAPDEPPLTGTIPLAPQSFAAILLLCNNSQKHHLCDHFFQQVKKRPEASGGPSILDRAHMEEVLKARLSLEDSGSARYCLETLEWMLRQEITGHSGPKIRPALSTFNLVLTACWRDGDLWTATRTFDLMTGYHSHDFMDGAVSDTPRLDKRAPGRNLVPTAETLSSLMRTALASHSRANVRQCLRIIDYLGVDQFFSSQQVGKTESNKAAKHRTFYASKLASAIIEAVTDVSNNKEKTYQVELRRWKDLAKEIRAVSTDEFIPTPEQHTRPRLTQYEKTL